MATLQNLKNNGPCLVGGKLHINKDKNLYMLAWVLGGLAWHEKKGH